MSWLTIYLISCTGSLIWFAITAWEDIQCHRGKKKPDHKFGLNYPSWNPTTWGFNPNPYFIIGGLIPGLNIFVWYILISIAINEVKSKLRP